MPNWLAVAKTMRCMSMESLPLDQRDIIHMCGSSGSDFWKREWRYPAKDLIYFADCPSGGHDMIALDYSKGSDKEPMIVHINQEGNYRKTLIAKNFESFIRQLDFSETMGVREDEPDSDDDNDDGDDEEEEDDDTDGKEGSKRSKKKTSDRKKTSKNKATKKNAKTVVKTTKSKSTSGKTRSNTKSTSRNKPKSRL
jgi:hypothetical protein